MIARELVGGRYTDALGKERVVPPATREAFIALLASDERADVAAPTRVLREGEPLTVDLALPADSWREKVLWTLRDARDIVKAGTLMLEEAPVLRYALHGAVTIDTRRLTVPVSVPLGDYRLTLDVGSFGHAGIDVLVCPARCHLPAEAERTWGLAIQLYTLRSEHNWGIGDFGDLARICALAADAGAALVGINPLHAAHRSDPEAASPYSPASRRFLNWLAIDVEALPEARCDAVRGYVASIARELVALRAKPLVDYTGVARVKAVALRRCFEALHGTREAAFAAFVRAGGTPLRRFAIYEALVARYGRAIDRWPPECARPESPGVEAFAHAEAAEVDLGMYLQWCAAEQLRDVAAKARARGVALYRDLAVGVEANSADVWCDPSYVRGATVGAPPDVLNALGQDWGLPPFSPTALRRDAYAAFAAVLAENMRGAGAMRIDHAMSLLRLFWIPHGAKPAAGAYVSYPFDDLLGVLARESVRARCAVIGEDLGTVPDGFRERMAAENVLSYRILLFERETDGTFLPPEAYPGLALAATGTHDLPPLAGWMRGEDIAVRQRIGLADPLAAHAEQTARAIDVARLEAALKAAGDLADRRDEETIVQAAYRFLARSPARIVMLQIEDVLGETMPVNVPGTNHEYPNWRRKLRADLDEISGGARLRCFSEILRELRPRA